jgi:hypothetical protein
MFLQRCRLSMELLELKFGFVKVNQLDKKLC